MIIETTFLKSKVARRVFMLFVLCALLPIIAFAGLSFRQVAGQLNEQSKRRLQKAVKTIGMGIYERLSFIEIEMDIISSLYISSGQPVIQTKTDVFGDRLYDIFNGLAVVNSRGEYYPFFGQILNPPKVTEDKLRSLTGVKTILSVQKADNNPIRMFMWMEIDPDLADHHFILAEINPNYIWGLSDDGYNSLPLGTEIFVLDKSNNIIHKSIPTLTSLPDQILSDLRNYHSGTLNWEHLGNKYISFYWSIFLKPRFHIPDWTVVLSESKAEVLAPMAHFNRTFTHAAILSFFVVILASFAQIKRNLLPIEILRKGTISVSKGDFNSKVNISSGDEFEDLGNSFNEMSKKIKEGQALLVQTAKMGAIGQMAAGIVHEINQPMTAISGLVQLSLLKADSEEQRERLEKIQNALERLNAIVTKFRSFSRRSDEKMVDLQVNQVIDDVYSLLEHQMHMKKVNCIIEKTEDLPSILGDNNSLQQVFTNLVINAMDALEARQNGDAQIKVRTYKQDSVVCVDVEDNGSGIPDDIQKRIFDPFFTTKSVEKGTGLGLAIIHSILHDHKAQLNVESQEGVGTRFSIFFPG